MPTRKTRGPVGPKATEVGKPPKTGGNGQTVQHDGRENLKGDMKYESGGKRDFEERIWRRNV